MRGRSQSFSKLLSLTAAVAVFCCPSANAENTATHNSMLFEGAALDSSGVQWEAAIVPIYGWVSGIRGNVGVFGVEASINVTPVDILRELPEVLEVVEGYYAGSGHLRYGKIGFMYDAVHLNVGSVLEFSGEGSVQRDFTIPGFGPIDNADLSLSIGASIDGIVDVAFSHTMGTLAGTYRAYETATSNLDVLAGVRISNVDLQVGVVADLAVAASASLKLGPISKSISTTTGTQVNASARESETWVDPLVGLRGRTNLDENWFATGWVMVGGFGIGSNFMSDLMGGIGYEWDDRFSAFAGYRFADTNYKNGDFVWDVSLHGPIMGVGARF